MYSCRDSAVHTLGIIGQFPHPYSTPIIKYTQGRTSRHHKILATRHYHWTPTLQKPNIISYNLTFSILLYLKIQCSGHGVSQLVNTALNSSVCIRSTVATHLWDIIYHQPWSNIYALKTIVPLRMGLDVNHQFSCCNNAISTKYTHSETSLLKSPWMEVWPYQWD